MESNPGSGQSSGTKFSNFLKSLPPPFPIIGAFLEFLGWRGFLLFSGGFILMNAFIYFNYVPWANLINYQSKREREEIRRELRDSIRVQLQDSIKQELQGEIKQHYYLSGNIVDVERNPIEDATIQVRKDTLIIKTKTDYIGRFDIDLRKLKVEVGDPIEIEVEKESYKKTTKTERFRTGISIDLSLRRK